MKKFTLISTILIALPIAGTAATDQPTAVPVIPRIDQSHPGSTLSPKEQIAAKHLAAAAAHEQAKMHHEAAATLAQPDQAREQAKEAEKASSIACEKSTEALMSTIEK